MSNYSRNIGIIFISLAVMIVGLSPHARAQQGGGCPCNFDFRFWTNPNWILTADGLFDECLANEPDDIAIEGLEIRGPAGGRTIVQARLTADTLSINRCVANIFAASFDFGGELNQLYLESHAGLTDKQLNNCIKKITKIAKAYDLCI